MKKFLFATVLLVGCSNAEWSKNTTFGGSQRVTVYSGGIPVKSFVTDGKVETEEHTDGWYFRERGTGKLVRVSGTVVIERE